MKQIIKVKMTAGRFSDVSKTDGKISAPSIAYGMNERNLFSFSGSLTSFINNIGINLGMNVTAIIPMATNSNSFFIVIFSIE
jgi:hypothetical protein